MILCVKCVLKPLLSEAKHDPPSCASCAAAPRYGGGKRDKKK